MKIWDKDSISWDKRRNEIINLLLEEEYGKIPKAEHKYDNSHLKHYYEELVQDIQKIL